MTSLSSKSAPQFDDSYEFLPTECLVGMKRGILCGRKIMVPPAFYALLQTVRSEKEWEDLIESLEIIVVPDERAVIFPHHQF